MATYGRFHTNYLQHVRIVDATLAAAVYVNQLVTYNPATGAIAASDDPTAENSAIIALSDRNFGVLDSNTSVPYTHTPVESKNLQYDGTVAATAAGTTKKVGIWLIIDPLDIVTYESDVIEQIN